MKLEIENILLENPKFDLIGWYVKYLNETGIFHQQYRKCHELYYAPIPYGEIDELENLPGLVAWPNEECNIIEFVNNQSWDKEKDNDILEKIANTLNKCAPFPGDGMVVDPTYQPGKSRFIVRRDSIDLMCIYDRVQGFEAYITWDIAKWGGFSIGKWFAEQCAIIRKDDGPYVTAQEWMRERKWENTTIKQEPALTVEKDTDRAGNNEDSDGPAAVVKLAQLDVMKNKKNTFLGLGAIQVDRNKYVSIQRNASKVKSSERLLPKPVIIKVKIDGQPARALIDSGSLGDFILSTLVDQLKLKRAVLDKAIGLQLAIQGSRSKINAEVSTQLEYQNIREYRRFDVINLNDYDLILGTPWMYQHQVCIGLNPVRIVIGSNDSLPINARSDAKFLLGVVDLEGNDVVMA